MMDFASLTGLMRPHPAGERFYGMTVGIVTNNQDPDNLGRVKVRFPWLSDGEESQWARLVSPMAGRDRGLYCLPEVDDEVLVAFEHGMPEFPYILGGLWNGQDAPPETNDDGENNKRTLKSRSGHTICLDDTDGAEKIEITDGSGKNTITLNTAENSITITADGDITLQSQNGKLILRGNGVEISSQAEVAIEASQAMNLKAGPEVKVEGGVINLN
jgi:uncharacterized protein involved in type VI secretion and phage assembly